jgi:transposase-like protein
MVRNSMRYMRWKHRKALERDLRKVYKPPTLKAADLELENFAKEWDPMATLISHRRERTGPTSRHSLANRRMSAASSGERAKSSE